MLTSWSGGNSSYCVVFVLAASLFLAGAIGQVAAADPVRKPNSKPLNIQPQPISSDRSVKYDFDIVYVRAPRKGDEQQIAWADVFAPLRAEPGSDLMLLHPDGREEVLVAAGDDAIADPFISFGGESVYYARIRNIRPQASDRPISQSSDIFKIHVKTRKVMQLTQQTFTPNTGVIAAKLQSHGIYNLGPCPVPGGKVMFTSNRNGFVPTKDYQFFAATKDYTPLTTLQLFIMDEDGGNVETIGHLNINSALHPTILKDGRVMFTSFETQGLRDMRGWAIWTIHPDGTNWGPLVSALGQSGETARHFMTQLSDGRIVFEEYYFQHNLGFGTYYKMAPRAPQGQPSFGPALNSDPRNLEYTNLGRTNSYFKRVPFSPHGLEELTPFTHFFNAPANPADSTNPNSPRLGKVTHPSAAPDNHLLTVWSPGPVHGIVATGPHYFKKPAIDSGIYLIKSGQAIEEPGQLLLIKNDPRYNEQWPRALVPYQRIYGVSEPARLAPLTNDGKRNPHLPEGTPYGLIGTSSLYKRETYPNGSVPPGKVTASFAGGEDLFRGLGPLGWAGFAGNWFIQGADAGKYDNSDIHAIRILITEPTSDPRFTGQPRRWWNMANERLRILGEFPVRKYPSPANSLPQGEKGESGQPLDPDGNPDTSFLAKIPADMAWTFQTLDKNGMVLNMAQTWHQLRPGEMRTDCGGCHAHSQNPTRFEDTLAARPDYPVFDLTRQTPLLAAKMDDQSGRKWDSKNETGLRFEKGVKNVEYFRDVKPILDRSCIACHTQKWDKPAGNLVLDDDRPTKPEIAFGPLASIPAGMVPGTYARLAMDSRSKYGHKSPMNVGALANHWAPPQASRYIRYFQSRRSLFVWKIYGQRLDGWNNEDFAYEAVPGDRNSLVYQGKPIANTSAAYRLINLAYTGSAMPPPAAVAGNYDGPDGKKIKVAPLSDEDRRTLVRWIDLGCPIDLDFNPVAPQARGRGWLQDDNRPTLTLTHPRAGVNSELTRILIGMHDHDSGLDLDRFQVVADFAIDDQQPGTNLAARLNLKSPGVWELNLARPVKELASGTLTVSVKDRQGNQTQIERRFSVTPGPGRN